jgi:hypothetical protein
MKEVQVGRFATETNPEIMTVPQTQYTPLRRHPIDVTRHLTTSLLALKAVRMLPPK